MSQDIFFFFAEVEIVLDYEQKLNIPIITVLEDSIIFNFFLLFSSKNC